MVCYFLSNWDLTRKVVIITGMPVINFSFALYFTGYKVLLVCIIPSNPHTTDVDWVDGGG